MHELLSRSARQIAKAIRDREVSSEEIARAALKRIDEVNPKLNAVVALAADRALDEARQRDVETARGEFKGLLHGVPITLKDSHDTEGIVTTGGTTGRREFVPTTDSPPVARLRAAGAVVLGKTNTPEFTMSFITENLVYGKTNNPYDVTRTPGGSSGGAAAIVAACGAFLELGSDLGGSVRVPANYCGIAGLKPTTGRVPRTGHIVPPGGYRDAFTTIGPLARRVDDLILTFPLIAGPDWRDPYIVEMPVRDPDLLDFSELRVATYDDNGVLTPTSEVMAAVKTAGEAIAITGARVDENRPVAVPRASEFMDRTRTADGGAFSRVLLERYGTSRSSPTLQSRIDSAGDPLDADGLAQVQDEMDQLRIEMLTFMDDYDAIVCPVSGFPAPLHDDAAITTFGGYTHIYNMTGWPAVVVRVGTSPEGLPIGVQVVARAWREDVALGLAGAIEMATGGWEAPAGL
ncbi:MAG TPA: amidase [Dehalococcoidia bacterium]|nr:amidase [Dehalococcoidia bacterium]